MDVSFSVAVHFSSTLVNHERAKHFETDSCYLVKSFLQCGFIWNQVATKGFYVDLINSLNKFARGGILFIVCKIPFSVPFLPLFLFFPFFLLFL